MKQHYFYIREKIKKIPNLLGPQPVSTVSSRVHPSTFSKLLGLYMARYMLLYAILPHQNNTFWAFSLLFYKKQEREAHIFITNIKKNVSGRSLCIFRTFGLLLLELGQFENQVFFKKITQNGSKQLQIVSCPYLNFSKCHN